MTYRESGYTRILIPRGYGNREKEAKWDTTDPLERQLIITHLLSFQTVNDSCYFEGDKGVSPGAIHALSLESFDNIPMHLSPFLFFAFKDETFSMNNLKESEHHLCHPPESSIGKD